MTIYEARQREHYEKIVDFLEKQPKESFAFQCMAKEIGEFFTDEQIEFLKEQKRFLHLFICEDDEKEVRVVGGFERRGFDPKLDEPKISTFILLSVSEDDLRKKEIKYFRELLDYLARYAYDEWGIEKSENWVPENLIEFVRELFGDSMEIIREGSSDLGWWKGKWYFIVVDVRKYLGV